MSDIFQERAARVMALCRARGIKALLIFPGIEQYYLAGISLGLSERPCVVVMPLDGEPFFFVPRLEQELRGGKSWITKVCPWGEGLAFVELAGALKRLGAEKGKIGISEEAPWIWIRQLEGLLPGVEFISATQSINQLRMRKTAGELELMERACRAVDHAVQAGFESLREGITEREVAEVVVGDMRRTSGSSGGCLVQFGAQAARPHAAAGPGKLKTGDVVVIDASAADRYRSDITRSVFFGQPTPRQRLIWETVLEAQRAAFEAIRPGTSCQHADSAARKVIEDAGFGPYFLHRLGHGIGLQIHEEPYLVQGNPMPLEPGMTFTIEPGIYIPGELGVRIEDTAVCTETSCRSLTQLEKKLSHLGLT